MSYTLSNTVASIKFVRAGKVFYLVKGNIKEITIARDDVLKISTGSCSDGICFRHKDVTSPSTATATSLVNMLNDWLDPATPPGSGE